MTDESVLASYIATWRAAAADFVALAREVPEDQWELPTDLEGWSVKDNVAHTAHLEGVLAGAPEDSVKVEEAPHIKSLTGYYTESGVVARRGRSMAELAAEIEQAVATRSAELDANPPTDGAAAPPRTPGGVGWSTETLLGNRPLDIWMHEQDIRRAIGRPGGYDTDPARHAITRLAGGLPMVLGKRVGPPVGTSVRIDLTDAAASFGAAIADDGRASWVEDLTEPTVLISLSAEDFVVLAGGRRDLAQTSPSFTGNAELGRTLLSNLTVTP